TPGYEYLHIQRIGSDRLLFERFAISHGLSLCGKSLNGYVRISKILKWDGDMSTLILARPVAKVLEGYLKNTPQALKAQLQTKAPEESDISLDVISYLSSSQSLQ